VAAALVLCAAQAFAEPPGFQRNFTYKKSNGAVDIILGKQVVARYVYKDTPKPYIYPLLSQLAIPVTRNYPMRTVAGEPTDHPHHRSFWIGFGDVNGVDFWSETDKSGKIVQTSLDFDPIAPGYWSIHTKNNWIGPDGKNICDDDRKTAFYSCSYGTLIASAITLNATKHKIKINDTKEGFFALRLAPSMALKGGTGHILNSEGDKDAAAWGKRARWIDYTGEVNGQTCGITIFDSPHNYGYPTYWHARDYGLLAANPFGGKAFTNDPKNDSSLTVPYTGSIRLSYVVLIHDGLLDAATLDALADNIAGRPKEAEKADQSKPADNNTTAIVNGKSVRVIKPMAPKPKHTPVKPTVKPIGKTTTPPPTASPAPSNND